MNFLKALVMVVAVVGPSMTGASTTLNIKVPFLFSKNIDPRNIFYVGDQVIVEHTYAFWRQNSWGKGVQSLLGDVEVNTHTKTLTLRPQQTIRDHKGKVLSHDDLLKAVHKSLSGTPHMVFQSLYLGTSLSEDKSSIIVKFKELPKNLEYLLTLADLALAPEDLRPIPSSESIQTGPYYFSSKNDLGFQLKENAFFPPNLKAPHAAKEISISQMSPQQDLKDLNPKRDHLVYLFGQEVTHQNLEQLKRSGYRVQVNPHEWLVNCKVSPEVDNQSLQKFNQSYFKFLDEFNFSQGPWEKSMSMAPKDHSFKLSEEEIKILLLKDDPKRTQSRPLGKKYRVGVMDEWMKAPVIKDFYEKLSRDFVGEFEFKIYTRAEASALWDESKTHFLIFPLGMGPSDPITTLSFLYEIHDIIPIKEINEWAAISDDPLFNQKTKELFSRIHLHKRIYPLGFFPGVVLENNNLVPNANLQYGWGIQAWTYDLPEKEI